MVGGVEWWCRVRTRAFPHPSPLHKQNTQTPPGFKTHAHYEDFSLPCFDGQHHIIMGGSFASTGACVCCCSSLFSFFLV